MTAPTLRLLPLLLCASLVAACSGGTAETRADTPQNMSVPTPEMLGPGPSASPSGTAESSPSPSASASKEQQPKAAGSAIGLTAAEARAGRLRPPANGKVWHITPEGAGDRSGSSVESAGRLQDLNRLIDTAAPGDHIWVHAQFGSYTADDRIELSAGGSAGKPISVRGVSSATGSIAKRPLIVGTRAALWKRGAKSGEEVFLLLDGADNLVFDRLNFRNIGNGAFRFGADMSNVALRNMDAANVMRFVENTTSRGFDTATVSGLRMEAVRVKGYSRAVARLRYDTRDVVISDVYGDSAGQDNDNFATGIVLDGTAHDVTIRRAQMHNNRDTLNAYWNGDGFSSERGNYDIRFEDTLATGNTDGGYDLKSKDTTLLRAQARDNKRNFRFWGTGVELRDSRGIDPKKRGGSGSQNQVWVKEGASVRIINSQFSDSSPATKVIEIDGSAPVSMRGGSITYSRDATLFNGKVERQDVTVNRR